MSSKVEWWKPPKLDPADQPLIDAYVLAGRFVDDLPYTEEFEALCARLGVASTNEARHEVFRNLLRLRKTGRLPRLDLATEPSSRQP